MRAILCDGYGAPADVLRVGDVDEPHLADDAVLVEVHAASVNPADCHLIRGLPRIARLSVGLRGPGFTVPGSDFAGRVTAVGANVTTVSVGDEVFGTTFLRGFGAFAERVAVPESLVARKPANVSYDAAAAIPLAATTALQGLRDHGRLRAGQRVLVVGASGGVGTFAVQLAKTMGAYVTGVCGARNVPLVRSLGADDVVDYTSAQRWDEGGPYDLILQLGGTASASALRRLLTREGTLVQLSGDSGNRWTGPLGRVAAGAFLSRFVSQTITTYTVRPHREDLEHLARLAADGSLRPVIDTTYALAGVADAIGHVERGHTRGKVVVDVRTPGGDANVRAAATLVPTRDE
ncbi:MAG TPA: NAD(P)-dependent alcohol dehydrogenase [Frankiaceae bacterium]|nr:NAD(P)-dependent alcohol dehydrogenase [Frankiaceae bacterium]